MRSLLSLAAAALVFGSSCASSKPKTTLAGSTPVLQLLRDWRGVWKGQVKDSPMGPMPYVLWIDEADGAVRVRMAPQTESGLESMKHVYELVEFDRGHPYVHYSLHQRNTTQDGEVDYRPDLSTDAEAVFCAPEGGCDKVRLSFTKVDERSLVMRSQVNESMHTEVALTFSAKQIPDQLADEGSGQGATLKRTRVQPKNDGEPGLDKDVYLEEHVDQDVNAPEDK